MPLIDVTDVLSSLDIACQSFTVVRRTETVNQYGESTLATVNIPVIGAIQPLGENATLREEMYTTASNGITVWTQTPIFNAGRDSGGVKYQPDLILWDGTYYLVRVLEPWSDYGAGFYKAECSQIDFEDSNP
jgi:hypothetical protein